MSVCHAIARDGLLVGGGFGESRQIGMLGLVKGRDFLRTASRRTASRARSGAYDSSHARAAANTFREQTAASNFSQRRALLGLACDRRCPRRGSATAARDGRMRGLKAAAGSGNVSPGANQGIGEHPLMVGR